PVWRTMLDAIRVRLSGYKVSMNIQSNLWKLDDDFIALFREHGVSVGTSLDGPKKYCDLTRGDGYFEQTLASVRKAAAAGFQVSAIATITPQTLPHVRETAKYFRNNGMAMVLHGAIAGMDSRDSPYALSASEYASMIKDLLPWYVENRKYTRIDTLDYFVKGAVFGSPGVCTFRDCFGMFLSISPTGDIASCQRLSGRSEYSMGNIFDRPTLAALYESHAALEQRGREQRVSEKCSGCDVYPVCKGGCYYNAQASGDGDIDPLCEAYKEIYSFVQDRLMEEMQTDENMAAIISRPADRDENPLLRRGAYISLSGKVHPSIIADNARSILSLYELSKTGDPRSAAQNLYAQKICGDPTLTGNLLSTLQTNLRKPNPAKNNCYIHATFDCNLRCSHCYAEGGERKDEMDVSRFAVLMGETIAAGFRQTVITGGEPLVHSQCDRMLAVCREHRGKGSALVLRTNLTGKFTDGDFASLAESFDQIVVSVDGNEETHDLRRGKGTYRNLLRNLQEYVRISASIPCAAELSLACVMRAADINGSPGHSVRELAESLHVKRTRFRPLLPLGRASQMNEPVICEGLMQHVSPEERLQSEFHPLTTCGIGQNLFIRPDGSAYPCYAWCGEHTCVGNIFDNGLNAVLLSPQFTRLSACTVDTVSKCRDCAYRYLCGGACRAWGNQQTLDLNAAPVRCEHLQQRAQSLIDAAKEYLEV
ncbi:MAG: SPASM domain-containing protein, partial [Dysgonamonadaceae bacterium]|nr:SPASM domain-containing protein [Dysgonamonadaceae bacterium]